MTKLFLSILLLVPTFAIMKSQNEEKVLLNKDSLVLFTDRSIYIAGEEILFSAVHIKGPNDQPEGFSKVLYLELITPEGMRMTAGKYQDQDGIFYGSLSIPQDQYTGLYYLKAYTRFLRNFGPDSYFFLPVKIINPQKQEVLSNGKESTGNPALFPLPNLASQHLQIEMRDSLVNTRDSFLISMIPGKELKGKNPVLFLSVALAGTISEQYGSVKPLHISGIQKGPFPAETRGITLSGSVTEKNTGKPLAYDKVNLSIMGRFKDFISVLTDSLGRFYFPLPPLTGKHDLFLFAEDKDDKEATVLVDNDYCTDHFQLPAAPFQWEGQEESTALKAAQNKQIEDLYYQVKSENFTSNPGDTIAFYGTPSKVILLDRYVQLPSMEEYINEFLPEVRVRKNHGHKSFYVFGAQSELNVYPPLVLIDQIAVPDAGKILAIPPEKMDRIEILNVPYIKGDMIYGGIISFITKKHDFAGIDLSSSGMFLRYSFFENAQITCKPMSSSVNLPDARTTLFWNPGIELKTGRPLEAWIKAGDVPGIYTVICAGITSEGERLKCSKQFRIVQ